MQMPSAVWEGLIQSVEGLNRPKGYWRENSFSLPVFSELAHWPSPAIKCGFRLKLHHQPSWASSLPTVDPGTLSLCMSQFHMIEREIERMRERERESSQTNTLVFIIKGRKQNCMCCMIPILTILYIYTCVLHSFGRITAKYSHGWN